MLINTGFTNLPYDLLIPMSYEETPFTKPTAITVKTRGTWSDVIPPKKERLLQIQKELYQLGFDFWIAFVKYSFKENKLAFEIYLIPVNELSDSDFKKVKRSDGLQEQIITESIKEKAWIKFNSRDT